MAISLSGILGYKKCRYICITYKYLILFLDLKAVNPEYI